MYKLKIFTVGKTKERWLEEGLQEYEKRLKPILSIQWVLAKHEEQLLSFLKKESHYICLDPLGKSFSSEEFSIFLHEALEKNGCSISFVIGGAQGLDPSIKSKASSLISLSNLTFTHQLTRLVLVEQLYRATEIAKGTQYHK